MKEIKHPFHTGLCCDTLFAERMFDFFHLGHQICDLDQRVGRVAAGDYYMGHMGFFGLQEIDHILRVDIAIAQRDVELVQQHHAVVGIADQLFGLVPRATGGSDVAFAVLRVPGKAFAHHINLTDIAKAVFQQLTVC